MSKLYRIIRAIVLSIVGLVVIGPAILYVVLQADWAQEKVRAIAETELSKALGTEVTVGHVNLVPFNRVNIDNVVIDDDSGKPCLSAKTIEARFEFWNFVTTGNLAFDYAVLHDIDARLYRATPDAPLNIAGIIEHLKSKEEKKEPTRFDLELYTVRIDGGSFSYDVLSEPRKETGFDRNHIGVNNLSLAATAPRLSNEEISVRLRHLGFDEPSGFTLRNLTADVRYTPTSLDVADLVVDLPHSHLDFGTYSFAFEDPSELGKLFNEKPIEIFVGNRSYLTVSDFGWVIPAIANVDRRFNIGVEAVVSRQQADIEKLDIDEVTDGGFMFVTSGRIIDPLQVDSLRVENLNLNVKTYAPSVTDFLRRLERPLDARTAATLNRLGYIQLTAGVSGTLRDLRGDVDLTTALGSVFADGKVTTADRFRNIDADIEVAVEEFDIGALLSNPDLGTVSTALVANVTTHPGRLPVGDVELTDASFIYRGHIIEGIKATGMMDAQGDFSCRLEADSDVGIVLADLDGSTSKQRPALAGKVTVSHFNPHALGLTPAFEGYELDADLDFDLAGVLRQWIDGYLNIDNVRFRSAEGPNLDIDRIHLTANNNIWPNTITVESDFLNGTVEGNVSLYKIVPQTKDILAHLLPAVFGAPVKHGVMDLVDSGNNKFSYHFELSDAENLVKFLKLPIMIIHPVSIDGEIDYPGHNMVVSVDAPYLQRGDMIIEGTSAQFKVNGNDEGILYLTTQFPTKKGDMVLVGGIRASDNRLDSEIDWSIERAKPIKGRLSFATVMKHDVDNGKLGVDVKFNPCDLQFGDGTWVFTPSTISYRPGYLAFDNFGLSCEDQAIRIEGVSSLDDPDSEIKVELRNIVLNNIFETLDINKALLSGSATGTFHVGNIFSKEPRLESNDLFVKNIGYNYCTLGDGHVKARWDNDKKSFYLDADIVEEDGRHSYITGDIFPTTESLDLTFVADRVKVGFMKPFMEAFAADVTGYASGHAHLFGTFKYIDMEGDIYAEDLGLKVDFTNTWYYATDSIHIRPGIIDIDNVTVRDVDGNTASLNGHVKHTFFKDPVFDFRVTEARNFLSYDVTPKLSPDWYGKIYGNGSAFISGHPGVVNIDVNMSTAPNSTFTFVLSDLEEAEQYSFLTFRDKHRDVITDSIIQIDVLPPAVREYRDRMRAQAAAQNPPSAYNMDIQVDITPDAKIVLVMDPVGGDEIKSWGSGSLRMTYASIGNDLRMYGTYTIDRGSYNFTLQDIIVKDFTISEGSSITFTGDPYNAALDIKAMYALNANLSDLDESFLTDRELNRTNVPVHALLIVRGDMRQPDIDFDLEFPTLTSDVYRKVRSIVSTDEMMNRQIIYLLALNRFYTPEYMSATKGNELFSVASSTISSRLSSMLGKLSENWTIAPNLRSDRGDFSDVQFDLALSSTLLNNRLRFNGNFGYRDKSLNTNQFVGDFDLEYLLNRSGSWRLKAYNRYNDQNYYLRTAKTTQGVGVMFRRDFDDIFGFLKRKKKAVVNDSIKGTPAINGIDGKTANVTDSLEKKARVDSDTLSTISESK